MPDHIRDAVIARAEQRGLTAYAIAKQVGMSPDAVKRYMTCRCHLNTRYVSAICEVLGLRMTNCRPRTG